MRLFELHECGADGYPPEWHAEIKHAVREAAGNRCVRCQHPYQQGEHGRGELTPCDERCIHAGPLRVWDYEFDCWGATTVDEPAGDLVRAQRRVAAEWRILTVHHLDGNKANCRWWNLVALCQRCHLQIQGKVRMARVWPWEHSDWFKPYVAGYYAWVYLSEDLTRDETEARMDELLALERLTNAS